MTLGRGWAFVRAMNLRLKIEVQRLLDRVIVQEGEGGSQ